ncbi:MAG: heme-copper oxidase subunit III, partial [Flavobacteriales bacterium]
MTEEEKEYEQRLKKSKKMLTYIGIFSIIMFFAGLTSAYIVSQSSGFWVSFDLPPSFWISTVIIIISSITFHLAYLFIKKDEQKKFKIFL